MSSERLVAADSLTECKGQGNSRICDGAVTKELKSTTPSVQVCEGGQLKVKAKKKVGAGAPSSGGGDCSLAESWTEIFSYHLQNVSGTAPSTAVAT